MIGRLVASFSETSPPLIPLSFKERGQGERLEAERIKR